MDLLETHCADCMDASKEGLVRAISEIEEALKLDLEAAHRLEGYNALFAAYRRLAFGFSEARSPEEAAAVEKSKAYARQAFQLAPTDPKVMAQHAASLDDPGEKLEVYLALMEVQPQDSDLPVTVGALQIRAGQLEAGFANLIAAAQQQRSVAELYSLTAQLSNFFHKLEKDGVECPLGELRQSYEEIATIKRLEIYRYTEASRQASEEFAKRLEANLERLARSCTGSEGQTNEGDSNVQR